MQRQTWLYAFVILGFPSSALAQDAGSLLRDREQGTEPVLPQPLPEAVEAERDQSVPEQGTPAQTILVTSVLFSGQATLLTDTQRTELARQVEGKEVGFSAIRALSEAATRTLHGNGHLLARAVLPPQDATAGTITLEIIEGKLGEIAFEQREGTRINESLLQGITDSQIERDHLITRDLESALLRMNDLPGVTARSRLAPGATAGTSRLIVNVAEEPIFSGGLYGDNFGSPSTGRAQGHAQLAFSDVTGVGDLTRLGFSLSEGQRYASGLIAVPLGASGVTVSIDYGYLSYENIDDVGKAAGLEGEAHYGTFGLTWQAIRTRQSSLRFLAELNGKILKDDSSAGRLSDKRIVSGALSAVTDIRDDFLGGGVTQIAIGWTYGDLDLSRLPSAEFVDALTYRTQGTFHRINGDLIRVQALPDKFSLFLRASGQWASTNLDSSESFSLGGPYGVRGWPVGEGRGDMGYLGTAELRYDVPASSDLGAIQFSTFIDTGRVRLNRHTYGIPSVNACSCNVYSLSSAGLGLSWRLDSLNLAASWAHGLGKNPGRNGTTNENVDGDSDRQQFWLSGSVRF